MARPTLVVLLLSLWAVAWPETAQAQNRVETLVSRTFTMKFQPARAALPLVDPLLSASGSVTWQQEENALVVKDRASVVAKIGGVLAEFDHPPRLVHLELYLLHATRSTAGDDDSPASDDGLPTELRAQLGSMLSLNRYQRLGKATVVAREGSKVTVKLGRDHGLEFSVGTVLRNRFLNLTEFRVERVRTPTLSEQRFSFQRLNLELQKPTFITVSREANSSSGLVVALLWRREASELGASLITDVGGSR